MSMMIHRAMARVNGNNAPKQPVKEKPQVEEIVTEETKPVEEEVRRGRPPKK